MDGSNMLRRPGYLPLAVLIIVALGVRTEQVRPLAAQVPDYALAYPGLGSCEILRGEKPWHSRLIISAKAPLFLRPGVLPTPLVLLNPGRVVDTISSDGEYFLVNYDPEGLRQPAYIHCAQAYPAPGRQGTRPQTRASSAPSASDRPSTRKGSETGRARESGQTPSRPPTSALPASGVRSAKTETLHGYAEWRTGDTLIVDGQRVRWSAGTRWDGVRTASDVPLGFEVTVTGARLPDGSVEARRVSAKPNGTATFERESAALSDQAETQWLRSGEYRQPAPDGSTRSLGRVLDRGPDVERVQRIATRLVPPYVDKASIRVRVIDTPGWNALAMANGSIWVFKGLLDDTNDDELASVLGHELVHFTHEHNRRSQRTAALRGLLDSLARAVLPHIQSDVAGASVEMARVYGLAAWQSGYSRDLEDQADRVGIRYAFEAGFDVTAAPRMWRRVLAKEGQLDPVTNFFIGDHSRPSDRIKNLEVEIQRNYSQR